MVVHTQQPSARCSGSIYDTWNNFLSFDRLIETLVYNIRIVLNADGKNKRAVNVGLYRSDPCSAHKQLIHLA
jgi:hypothetical protein